MSTLSVPQYELRRVAEANNTIVTIAQDLARLAEEAGNSALANKLRADGESLAVAADTIDSALRIAIKANAA